MSMRQWTRHLLIGAASLAGLATWPAAAFAAGPPSLSAQAAILVDGNTGQILFAQDSRGEFYPASITKIMTAYLAITHAWHRTVVVSQAAQDQIGSSAYLVAGERLPMSKVVTAMMLVSGNDAAYAVAQTVAGSVPAFVRMMNQQARAWGAPGIHFDNPDGLPDPKHVVTALGMAIIAEHAMRNPIFRRIVDTKISTLPPNPKPRTYYNQNQLLYNFPGAVGIKIGYTIEADETIVGAARRHGLFLIEVLLHDTPVGLWPDAENLLNWGLNNFRQVTLVRRGERVGTVRMGRRTIVVEAARTVNYLVPLHTSEHSSIRLSTAHPYDARLIRQNAQVGQAAISVNGRLIASIPLLSANEVRPLPPTIHWNWWWLVLPLTVGAALIKRPSSRLTAVRGGSKHG